MSRTPTAASRWLMRCLVALACTAATLISGGPTLGATPVRHTAQAPVCSSAGGAQVCIQGWSTGITFTYSGSSTDADGHVLQDGSAFWGYIGEGAKPVGQGYLQVNWHGTGTLFVPLPEGQWVAAGAVDGGNQGPPAISGTPAILDVGPSEPPPPTTCSTVAQGMTPVMTGQPQPWVSGISATTNGDCPGYWIASPAGPVDGVGGAPFVGCDYVPSLYDLRTGCVAGGVTPPVIGTMVGIARTPDSEGYWLAASDGGVFAVAENPGDPQFYGSMSGIRLNQPIVGITATEDGKGYWLVASDGGVFAFGDAAFYGSMGGTHLNKPIVGITATADGNGYWMVASDGGVFSFGDAAFRGSLGGGQLNQPIVAVAADPDGSGYWLLAADGGVFAYGAAFLGSLGGAALSAPIVGMSPTTSGTGYYLVGADSAVYAFGNAHYLGAPIRQG